MTRYILGIILIGLSVLSSADTTRKSMIKMVLYNGTADYLWFISDTGWDVTDGDGNVLCTPYYVQVTSSVAGRDKIMSIGLAAKMARSEVDFIGECSTNPSYFNAYYIRVY